jgi:hypothetical protein
MSARLVLGLAVVAVTGLVGLAVWQEIDSLAEQTEIAADKFDLARTALTGDLSIAREYWDDRRVEIDARSPPGCSAVRKFAPCRSPP